MTVSLLTRSTSRRRVVIGPFAAIVIGALFLIALQWYRNGPNSGGVSIPAAFLGQPQTVAAGVARASAEKKVMIAFATASWCGPCQAFKQGALADQRVTDALRATGIPAYIDVDKDQAGAGSLKVFSIPVLIALRDGREVGRMEGVRSAKEVLDWLSELPK
ncbi:MAG: thioredoxin family protein [Planctomycetes bacterium]|nr:thioredoxin family protein [Planctomycetota bacterium]